MIAGSEQRRSYRVAFEGTRATRESQAIGSLLISAGAFFGADYQERRVVNVSERINLLSHSSALN